jgi:hypothetical protein
MKFEILEASHGRLTLKPIFNKWDYVKFFIFGLYRFSQNEKISRSVAIGWIALLSALFFRSSLCPLKLWTVTIYDILLDIFC